jgi:hypothetical protein
MTRTLKPPVPVQHKGGKSDTRYSRKFHDINKSVLFFQTVKERLLDISGWDKLCKGVTAQFQLCDELGNPVQRTPAVGDHIRIDIPGPGTVTGEGYDWVRIEEIRNDDLKEKTFERLLIRVRPVPNPTNKNPEAAHFFKEDASSTFIVQRKGSKVCAEIHGRNELPNTKPVRFIDRLRNFIIAIAAMIGLSSTQWKKLVKGLVREV